MPMFANYMSPLLKKNMTFHRICSFGKQCECVCVFGVCVVISSNITKKAHTMIGLYYYSRYFISSRVTL